jgi:hypothetical protein
MQTIRFKEASIDDRDLYSPPPLCPDEVLSMEDLDRYYRQRLGPAYSELFAIHVNHIVIGAVSDLLERMRRKDNAAYRELWTLPTINGAFLITSHIESPTVGDRAAKFLERHADNELEREFSRNWSVVALKLQSLNTLWAANDKPYYSLDYATPEFAKPIEVKVLIKN